MSSPTEVVLMILALGVGVPVFRFIAMRLPVRWFRRLGAAFVGAVACGFFWMAYLIAFGSWRSSAATPTDADGGAVMMAVFGLLFVAFAVAVLVTKGDPWAKYRQGPPGSDA